MFRIFAAILLFSSMAHAQVESLIQFRGQNAETIKLDKAVNVVRAESYEYEDSCSRDIPYESYECNDVTRYRQECGWIPESQNCWNENEQVCRPVTRYRQECSRGPSRRVCTSNPPRQVCTERPSREVCTERPTREVCRTRPDGSQSCTTVGGGQSCQTVGGGQSCTTVGGGESCHDVEGPQTCRDVPYTDNDCTTVSHRRCETIPGRNECHSVPYTEQECGNVTRYRQEHYSCTRTATRDVTTPKQLKGAVSVEFITNGIVEEFPLSVLIAPTSQAYNGMKSTTTLKKEPKVLVALKKNSIEIKQETDKEIIVDGSITYELVEPKMVSPSFPSALSPAFNENTHVLTLGVQGSMSAAGRIEVLITRKPFLGKRKTVAELKAEYPSERVKIVGNKIEINLKGLVKEEMKKKMDLDVKLSADLSVQGQILNAKKPEVEKSYSHKLKL